ncbi:MAG: prepilin-type N-terminal cleavage/methylation domain-containing protein [Spirochaetales bacterium]|jgi:type IV pilus assembly protein PilV|nr:prepilin-type N-terminal cleavage/methylation domain-containing protein [Spirochaetales bacterium]
MKLFKKIINNSKGFTLMEVLIALAIFAIGILGVAKMQLSGISGNASSRGVTEAATIGQQQLEILMSLPYDDDLLVDTNNDGTNQDADNDGSDDNGGNFGLDETATPDHSATFDTVYNLFWNIAVDEPVTDAKKIRMIVRWKSSGFGTKEIVFDTIKVSM